MRLDDCQVQFYEALQSFATVGERKQVRSIQLHNLTEPMLPATLEDQMQVISEISNAFWNSDRLKSDKVLYTRRLSWKLEDKYYPYSIRNQIIYYFQNLENNCAINKLSTLCSCIVSSKMIESTSTDGVEAMQASEYDEQNDAPVVKRRRTTAQVRVVRRDALVDRERQAVICMELPSQVSIYNQYEKKLVEQGQFIWRFRSSRDDIILMNDISESNGEMNYSLFSHVYINYSDDEELLRCSCSTYKVLQQLAVQQSASGENIMDIVLDVSSTCVHCRFVRDHFLSKKCDILNSDWEPVTGIEILLKNSLARCNEGVVQIGSTDPYGTIKFSVLDEHGSCELVHLTRGGLQLICQSGLCNAHLNKFKCDSAKVKSRDESKPQHLCPHLLTMKANATIWDKYLQCSDSVAEDSADVEDDFVANDSVVDAADDVNEVVCRVFVL